MTANLNVATSHLRDLFHTTIIEMMVCTGRADHRAVAHAYQEYGNPNAVATMVGLAT